MRLAFTLALTMLCVAPATGDEPLEKQFFDYFMQRCEAALEAEWKAADLDPENPEARNVLGKYCSCTSQAVVSFLTAEEIIAFANNPEQEPAAGKMRPHFQECQERARKKAGQE
ncbi:hypothetical protein [Dongia deserti]|uniref:hypothetical protein n=1 Tax=Dongia deserti TaxID=2268030 RepID=UPI000E65972E|nr:hypothetical protein [Dongia deserti]